MSSRPILLLLAVLAVVGLAVWLLGGGLGLGDGDGLSRDREGAREAADRAAEDGGRTAAGLDGVEDPGPVLFGRPAADRVGRGSVHGKVLTAATNEPVAEARVLLTGTGFGGEDVAWRGRTDAGGAFRVPEAPAGDGYDLTLEAEGHPGRTVPGVSVRDGSATALGTLWMGSQVGLAGRVLDERGEGIPQAVVQLHAGHVSLLEMFGNLAELFSNLDREPEGLARTTTDGRGHFVFEAVDPGPLTLTVRAHGYESGHREVVAAERVDETPIVVRLPAGRTVRGRVLDANGRGVPDARVAAVSSDDPFSFLFGRTFSETAADGSFEVDASASTDEVTLLASAPGYVVRMHKTPPGSQDVRITLDRSATLVVRLLETSGSEPVEGASVMLGISGDGDTRTGAPESIVTGVTDASGRFTCDVPPGKIQMVMVSCADGRSGMWSGGAAGGMGAMLMEGPEDATVAAGRQEMEFRLQDTLLVTGTVRNEDGGPISGARIRSGAGFQIARPVYSDGEGRYAVRVSRGGFGLLIVRAEGYLSLQEMLRDLPEQGPVDRDLTMKRAAVVRGRVFDAAGRPLPGARVRAKGSTSHAGMATMGFLGEAESLTDGQGRYVIDGVAPGEAVRVMARHTATTDGVSEPFGVGQGGSVRAPDLVLHAGRPVDVLVHDPHGLPVANARIELSFDGREMPDWDAFDFFTQDVSLVTNAQGRATAEQIPPCALTVTATHPSHARGTRTLTIPSDASAPLRVEVSLGVAVPVAGRVLDGAGQPVAGAWVSVQPEGEEVAYLRARTDADGRFEIERVPEGPFTIHAGRTGYRAYEETRARGGEDLVLTLRAHDPATQARREELQRKIADVYGRLQQAKSDQETQALSAELQALSAEIQALDAEDGAD